MSKPGALPKRPNHKFTESEKQFVLDHVATMTVAEMAKHLNRSYCGVENHLIRRGLYKLRRTVKRANSWSVMSLPVTEMAYLAGIVDGEGSIGIARHRVTKHNRTYFRPHLTISNTNEDLLEWLQARHFRGNLVMNTKHRPYFKIAWGGFSVAEVLKALLPYLVIKRRHAELLIEFCKLRIALKKKYKLTPRMELIYMELRRLNWRQSPPEGGKTSRRTSSTT